MQRDVGDNMPGLHYSGYPSATPSSQSIDEQCIWSHIRQPLPGGAAVQHLQNPLPDSSGKMPSQPLAILQSLCRGCGYTTADYRTDRRANVVLGLGMGDYCHISLCHPTGERNAENMHPSAAPRAPLDRHVRFAGVPGCVVDVSLDPPHTNLHFLAYYARIPLVYVLLCSTIWGTDIRF